MAIKAMQRKKRNIPAPSVNLDSIRRNLSKEVGIVHHLLCCGWDRLKESSSSTYHSLPL
jgi:hypothetical protein